MVESPASFCGTRTVCRALSSLLLPCVSLHRCISPSHDAPRRVSRRTKRAQRARFDVLLGPPVAASSPSLGLSGPCPPLARTCSSRSVLIRSLKSLCWVLRAYGAVQPRRLAACSSYLLCTALCFLPRERSFDDSPPLSGVQRRRRSVAAPLRTALGGGQGAPPPRASLARPCAWAPRLLVLLPDRTLGDCTPCATAWCRPRRRRAMRGSGPRHRPRQPRGWTARPAAGAFSFAAKLRSIQQRGCSPGRASVPGARRSFSNGTPLHSIQSTAPPRARSDPPHGAERTARSRGNKK